MTYAAPASGASATLSAATATTNASVIATVTATANRTAGTYNVTATTSIGTSTAAFALTNTDFTITPATSTLTVSRGSTNTDVITLTTVGGFNGTVTFGCSGLSAGTTCTFSPATVTPTAATASTNLTIAASQTALLRWLAGHHLANPIDPRTHRRMRGINRDQPKQPACASCRMHTGNFKGTPAERGVVQLQKTNFPANWIKRGLLDCEVTCPKPLELPERKPVPGNPN